MNLDNAPGLIVVYMHRAFRVAINQVRWECLRVSNLSRKLEATMSDHRGGFAGRRSNNYSNSNDRQGTSESGPSRFNNRGQGRQRGGRHPAHLKGKDIGMYYKKKAEKKDKDKHKNMEMIRLSPHLLDRIERVLEEVNGFYDKQYNNDADSASSSSTLETKYTHIHDSAFKRKFLRIISENIQDNLARSPSAKCKLERNDDQDTALKRLYTKMWDSQEYERMRKVRLKLPACQFEEEILKTVEQNQIVLIKGETGCGKTTQIPQFILDSQLQKYNGSVTRIICTQPRRISAISIAERVAVERAERLGESVGYQIRLEKVLPRNSGSIVFCTTGVLLQFMRGDPALRDYSHIILDEVHERSIESDFILALLKLILPVRPDLKVILMSATLNADLFSKYFDNCPMMEIPGFTYPVTEYYLEDVLQFTQFQFEPAPELPQNYKKHLVKFKQMRTKRDEFTNAIEPHVRQLAAEKKYSREVLNQLRNPNSETMSLELIEELIRYICQTQAPGAILVFLPGLMDITKVHKLIQASGRYPNDRYVVYPVHSRMPTVEQRQIFQTPPRGVRKIILATSIAETSVTIEDVVYVIDSGKMKMSRFDVDKNLQTLEPEWVSLANAQQRRGRAGRVKDGICYHLFSKGRELMLDRFPLPEMLRTRLEGVILQIKILQLGKARRFLASVIDPPSSRAIDLSLELLNTLNALDNSENLTPLGYHLAHLPVDPRTGKMIIWASLFSCVEPVFAIAASLTFKDAFYCPIEREDEARKRKLELSLGEYSDHIALAEALRRFEIEYSRGNAGYFCRQYFLSMNTLRQLSDMKTQFAQYLEEMRFLGRSVPSDPSANRNSDNIALVKAIVCAGLYPNVAVVRAASRNGTRAWTPEDGGVLVHPSSVNDKIENVPSPYMMYFTKQRSTRVFLHDTSCISAPILLFAAPNITIKREKSDFIISLPTMQTFKCELRTARLIQKLQEELNNMLEYKITHPGEVCWSGVEGKLLNAIIDLVCQNNEEMNFGPMENFDMGD